MKLLRKLLFPIVPIYYLITWLRNKFYDAGIKKPTSYNFPVICVGNLSVGGTGKTPMVEYLVKLLKKDNKVSILSRGYKRETKGFQLADENVSAESIGDEPFQFYNKFDKDILVAVDSDRRNGIQNLKNYKPDVVLLDDAFQHRKVKPGLSILLTTYTKPYFSDIVLPTGNLREPKSGVKRADIIIITKCPDKLPEIEKEKIIKKVRPKKHQHVFFSTIEYSSDVFSVDNKTKRVKDLQDFTLVTGIANSNPLVNYLKSKKLKFSHLNFKDHYKFLKQDIDELEKQQLIITTEKDYMRLKPYESLKDKLFYLPIKLKVENDIKFSELIKNFMKPF